MYSNLVLAHSKLVASDFTVSLSTSSDSLLYVGKQTSRIYRSITKDEKAIVRHFNFTIRKLRVAMRQACPDQWVLLREIRACKIRFMDVVRFCV